MTASVLQQWSFIHSQDCHATFIFIPRVGTQPDIRDKVRASLGDGSYASTDFLSVFYHSKARHETTRECRVF
jgi:hypothetical protein